jgi:D-serine deaminase-like pyridoxal phosphate-dependent protein
MGCYFADSGWDDILVAVPCNHLEIDRINELADRINLHVFIVSEETASFLAKNLKKSVGVYIEIDTGDHRTGLQVRETATMDRILTAVDASEYLELVGFYSHPGHTYIAQSKALISEIYERVLDQMNRLKKKYSSRENALKICVGDTPGCKVVDTFTGLDEISPGNFVFYDMLQCHLGVCRPSDVAVAVICPVIAKYPQRNEVIVYGGAVHLSEEYLEAASGNRSFGVPVEFSCGKWGQPLDGSYVKSLSQEHGVIHLKAEYLKKINIGDLIGILPVHSCITCNLFREYRTADGKRIPKM